MFGPRLSLGGRDGMKLCNLPPPLLLCDNSRLNRTALELGDREHPIHHHHQHHHHHWQANLNEYYNNNKNKNTGRAGGQKQEGHTESNRLTD